MTITGTGNLNFTAAVTSPTVSITTTGGIYTDAGVAASTKATISASGNVSLGTEATLNPSVSVTSTGGSIIQTGALNITAGTFNAPTITLTMRPIRLERRFSSAAAAPGTPVQLQDAVAALTIGNGTNVAGATTIINSGAGGVGAIAFGAAAADTLGFGSTLSVTATGTGAITTVSTNLNVTGAVTANTTNSAVTLGASGTSNSGFGTIGGSSGSGLFTVNSSKPVNLGTLTTTGGLAVAANGNITNTGNLVVTASGRRHPEHRDVRQRRQHPTRRHRRGEQRGYFRNDHRKQRERLDALG